MGRLPERDIQGGGNEEAPDQLAPEQRRDRDHLPLHLHRRAVPGVHQTHPVHRLRLRAQRGLLQLGEHLEKLAGQDRRRRRRQSDQDRSRRRRDQGQLHRQRQRAPDPQGRLRGDQTADLPRGELLHRTRPRQPERAGDGQRRNDPGQPHLDRGPDRRNLHLAAVAGARQLQPRPGSVRRRPLRRPDRGRRRDPAARGQGQDRRRRPQRGAALRRPGRPLRRPGRRRAARQRAAGPAAPGRRDGPHLRRLRRQRGRPPGSDRQLQHLHRGARRAVGKPLGNDPPLRPRPQHQPRPRSPASTRRCRRCAPGRSRSGPRSPACRG